MTAYRYQTKKGIRWEYLCNYVDYDGSKRQRHKQGFMTKKEALEAEREFLTSRKYDNNTTLRSGYELFQAKKFPGLRPTSIKMMRNSMKHLEPFMDTPLALLNEEDIQSHINSQDLAPATKRMILNRLKQVYAFSARACNIPRSRLVFDLKSPRRDYKIYTLEQYQQFREHTQGICTVFFDLLYFTGARKGEILALNTGDVGDSINIYKTIDEHGIIAEPKTTSSIRSVFLPKFLQDELKDYIARLPDPEGPLFPVNYAYFKKFQKRAEAAAGLHHIRMHDFRHSHASYLISKNVNVADISKRLGHSNIGTTLRFYAHLYKDADKEIANMIDISVRNP